MKYIVSLNDKKYEVEVEKGQAAAVYAGAAAQGGDASDAALTPQTAAGEIAKDETAKAELPQQTGGGNAVVSPMPGTILDIRCQTGQNVKQGEVLFILEAMKMENEITAAESGIITAVSVSKNQAVETNTVLCTIG